MIPLSMGLSNMASDQTDNTISSRMLGCFLGGAVGDALGAPIEFLTLDGIRETFGEQGLTDYASAFGYPGAITDDTQMSLFTAEGLIRAADPRAESDPLAEIYKANLRWLYTQESRPEDARQDEGWLLACPDLYNARMPGVTIMTALQDGRGLDRRSRTNPINDSKGCGTVMKTAPIGMTGRNQYDLAADAAALTHGHPSGYAAAGFLTVLIHCLCSEDMVLEQAIREARRAAGPDDKLKEVLLAVDRACELAVKAEPSPETVETLGGGWVAEEALAIGLYCALAAHDFTEGVLLSVNHSGDSDSTGAVAGNILGVIHGVEAIPHKWLNKLECGEIIEQMGWDMLGRFHNVGLQQAQLDDVRYPPANK